MATRKLFVLIGLCLGCILPMQAQKQVSAKLDSVTVYLKGATLYHSAPVTLKSGSQEVIIDGLSPDVATSSLKVSANGVLISAMEFSKDFITPKEESARLKKLSDSLDMYEKQLQEANDELHDYVRNIDYVMNNGGVRIVNYSPDSHTLTIFSEIEHIQHRLTQTRLLMLTADESRKTALRIMNNMDNLTRQPVKAVVKTILRAKEGKPLYLSFSFVPTTDANGKVTKYFGMCRDISDIKATEELLAQETKKAQEVETVKDAFLHNMCNEIRPPINSVVRFAKLIENNPAPDDEKYYIEEIKAHSRNLLNLVNNILLLSRLDAGMIEFKTTPVDFAAFFEGRCKSVWMSSQKPGVDYIVDAPYHNLTLNIDMNNLGIVIDQIVTNAVQHTMSGQVHAHFDYNGEDLTMAFQDTGCGIPAEQFEKIFERFDTTHSGRSGLGLPICQEIVKLMGGKIRLKSEVGKGTVFWVVIPCKED